MKNDIALIVCAAVFAGGLSVAPAHAEQKELPPGPIRDRHELMERIGRNAKVVGEAVKGDALEPLPGAADAIKADAEQTLPLFPPGSVHEASRARPEIWTDWATFERGVKDLQGTAGALAETARAKGDVAAAAKKMFGTCKSCHDKFRLPEE